MSVGLQLLSDPMCCLWTELPRTSYVFSPMAVIKYAQMSYQISYCQSDMSGLIGPLNLRKT